MNKIDLNLAVTRHTTTDTLSNKDKALWALAQKACNDAYAPYSGFFVGAAIRLNNGKIVTGTNQENVAYPSGLCAERVAIFSASSQYPDIPIDSIAVTAKTERFELTEPLAPCGACRQVMSEYEQLHHKPIRLLFSGGNQSILVAENIKTLLPFSFHANGLKK